MHISAERIAQIEARRDEVQASMTRADLPPEEFVRLSKEYAEVEPVARAAMNCAGCGRNCPRSKP